jgi:glucosamine-6-phosphate deaminase
MLAQRKEMEIRVFSDRRSMGKAAANHAAEVIRRRLHGHGRAWIVAATAASQDEFLEELTRRLISTDVK